MPIRSTKDYTRHGTVARVYGVLGSEDIQLVVSDPKACYNIFINDQALFEKPEATLTDRFDVGRSPSEPTKNAEPRIRRRSYASYCDSNFPSGRTTGTLSPLLHKPGAVSVSIASWKSRVNCVGWPSRDQHHPLDRQVYARFLRRGWSRVFLRYSSEITNIAERSRNGYHARRIYETKKRLLELGDGATVEQVGGWQGHHRSFQAIVLAATDTTSSALSRILHLLALHPDIQDKLGKELKEACKDNGAGEIAHDQLVSLPFLEAVCRKTLRLARSDVVLPLSSPIHDLDGRDIYEIFVPENTNLYVQIYNLSDPSIWGIDAETRALAGTTS
ncbi:cytochrome P450 [Lactarius akahatsu]|uniref:Cytochrome P450 n=1 Tax=Lactarius akahatsu TaxID=416441 RepID=A0AAD4LFL6_9AGAM|nr:cytochrome P450 [Lactarius akahatsu]